MQARIIYQPRLSPVTVRPSPSPGIRLHLCHDAHIFRNVAAVIIKRVDAKRGGANPHKLKDAPT